MAAGRKPLHVEIRLPFCPKTCQYCSMPSDYATALLIPRYCDALVREIEVSAPGMEGYEVTSVHIGGGAPTYVKSERVIAAIEALRHSFALAPHCEVSLKALPAYVNEFSLRSYREAGVNAIDVDHHVCDPRYTRFTGRELAPEQEAATVRAFGHYGFANVSYGLRYGLPGQTEQDWLHELEGVLAWEPTHLSMLPFAVPGGSQLYRELNNLRLAYGDRPEFRRADKEGLAAMGLSAAQRLKERGFAEYLPGRFALPGFERRWLLDRSAGVETLAFGAGGVSHLDGAWMRTTNDIAFYADHPGDLGAITERAWGAA